MENRETRTPENLLAGGVVPYLRESMRFKEGVYKRGMLLELDSTTLNLSKCTDISKFYGVLSEDLTVLEAEPKNESERAMVYVSGMFYKTGVITEETIDVDTELIVVARKLNIYFR